MANSEVLACVTHVFTGTESLLYAKGMHKQISHIFSCAFRVIIHINVHILTSRGAVILKHSVALPFADIMKCATVKNVIMVMSLS